MMVETASMEGAVMSGRSLRRSPSSTGRMGRLDTSSPLDARPSTPTTGASHPAMVQRNKPPVSLAPLSADLKSPASSRPSILSPVDANRLSDASAALLSPARAPARLFGEPPAVSPLPPGIPRAEPADVSGRPSSGPGGASAGVMRAAPPHTLPSLHLPTPPPSLSATSPGPGARHLSNEDAPGRPNLFARDRLGGGLALTALHSLEIGDEEVMSPTQATEGEAGRRRQKLEIDVPNVTFSPKSYLIAQSPLANRSPFTNHVSPLNTHLTRLSPLGPAAQVAAATLASPLEGTVELDTLVERRIQRVSMDPSTPKGISTPKAISAGFTPRPTSTPTRGFSFGRWRGEPADAHSDKGSPLGAKGGRPMAGLANLGNTCFMNTILQCLLSTDALLGYLQGGRQRPDALSGEKKALKIVSSVEELVRDMSRAKPMSSVAPSNFLRQLVAVAPHFDGNEEHDCQEFLTTLLELMNDDLNRAKLIRNSLKLAGAPSLSPSSSLRSVSPGSSSLGMSLGVPLGAEDERAKSLRMWKGYLGECNSIITDLFAGQLCSSVRCSVCQQRQTMYESFLDLSVPIPKGNWVSGGSLTDLADWAASPSAKSLSPTATPHTPAQRQPLQADMTSGQEGQGREGQHQQGLPDRDANDPNARRDGRDSAAANDGSASDRASSTSSSSFSSSRVLSPSSVTAAAASASDISIHGGSNAGTGNAASAVAGTLSNNNAAPATASAFDGAPAGAHHSTCDSSINGTGPAASEGGPQPCPLEECLHALTEEEPLEGDNAYMCRTCGRRQRAVKRMTLCRLPHVLVIHIKRFTYSATSRDKLSTLVSFPLRDLSLAQFCSELVPQEDAEEAAPDSALRLPASYHLFAVGHHAGSMASGHYFAHCLNQDDKNWYCFNDDAVTPISAASVVAPSAYLLFYKRSDLHSSEGGNE